MELAKCHEALRTQVRHSVAHPTPAATQHTYHQLPPPPHAHPHHLALASFVDVVKLDIEGGEWETLASGDATDPAWGLGDHVGQLAIDFHFGMGKYSEATASAVFQHLEDQGYQLFHRREGTKTSDYVAFRGQGMHNLQDTSWVKL